ncbi:terpene synthase family protein [Actinomadura sp. NEAU-AAG7]|uniref:terpene synthase family protein n=1 Tax=Actinomadura sp. NEAU-AAG7 TaxID=2839640 RepID=UPI0020324AC6|nr:terpene synthase family protein [Actinomadura sp. NEAU-AAG7]MBT2207719.1 hypothetical protein [Actinomadura sp. NEAU-AAG7]
MLFAPGTQFHLPELTRSIPVKIHPRAAECEAESEQWVRAMLGAALVTEQKMEEILEERGSHWACLGFPTATGRRMTPLCDLSQFLFAFDSDFTNRMGSRGELDRAKDTFTRIFGIMAGATPAPAMAYEIAFHDVWRRIAEVMNPPQRKRFVDACTAYLNAQLLEVAARERDEIFDFETYMEIHRDSIATRPYCVQIEYGLEIDLSEIIEEPPLKLVHRHTSEHFVLVNDLFSFPLECAADDYVNAVAVFCAGDGMPLQAAINRLCALIDQAEANFIRARAELLASSLGGYPGLRAYVDALGLMMSGSLHWSYFTTRYHGPGFVWNGATSGLVTLYPDHVTFE